MPAGDQQPIETLRQYRAIRRVIITAAGDAVGEVHAASHIVLGDDVFALQEAGLADAGLRRDVDHVTTLEARKVSAHIVDQSMNPAPPFKLGLGQIFHFQPV
jgi:hypothetical protein